MQVQITQEGEILVVAVSGRMDAVSAPEFDSQIGTRLTPPPARLVIDLGELEYISSAGLRSLLMVAKKLKAAGEARLVLCGLNAMVDEVFEVSGFKKLFTVCADRDQALAELA